MIVREIDERDFNFIGIIMSDLYASLNKEYIDNILVLEDELSRIYVLKEENFLVIYQPYYDGEKQTYTKTFISLENNHIKSAENEKRRIEYVDNGIELENKQTNSNEFISHQESNDYYGYNGAILYCKKIDNKLIQMSYSYNILNPVKIYKYWLKKPTHIVCQYNKIKNTSYEYCTIDTDYYTYLYQYFLTNGIVKLCHLLSNLNMVEDMKGFYIKSPFKLGKTYSYEDIQKIISTVEPSDEIINLFNQEDEEFNFYQQLIDKVSAYLNDRPKVYSKIYIKNDSI